MKKLTISFLAISLSYILLSHQALSETLKVKKIQQATSLTPSISLITNSSFENLLDKDLKEFLKLSVDGKEQDFNFKIIGNEICFYNLKPNTKYEIEIKKGFKGDSFTPLDKDLSFTYTTQNAQSAVNLPHGILLTTQNAPKLNLETVNLDKLSVKLFRLSEKDIKDNELYRIISHDNLEIDDSLFRTIQESTYLEGEIKLNLENKQNEKVFTKLDLDKLSNNKLSGLYILLVTKEDADTNDLAYNDVYLAKPLVITDLATTTYQGSDGLLVQVRNFSKAVTLENAEVSLIAFNNTVLGQGKTDKNGFIRFDKKLLKGQGALAPLSVITKKGNDIQVIDLRSSPLYFEQDISPYDLDNDTVFAYLDRDLVKKGENINLNVLVRDKNLNAKDLKILHIKLKSPYGQNIFNKSIKSKSKGAFELSIDIPKVIDDGIYTLSLSADGKNEILHRDIKVENFAPQNLILNVLSNKKVLKSGENKLAIEGRYNYGALLKDGNSQAFLTITPDNYPFSDDLKLYAGPNTKTVNKQESEYLQGQFSEKQNSYIFDINLNEKNYARSISANFNLYDKQGMGASDVYKAKVLSDSPLVAIKRLSDDSFSITKRDPNGNFIKDKVSYELYKINTSYQYALDNGHFRFTNVEYKVPLYKGEIDLQKEDLKVSNLKLNLENGRYEIVLKAKNSYTEYRFDKGYITMDMANNPERFDLVLDKDIYKLGDTAILSFHSNQDGMANLVIGSNEVKKITSFNVKKGVNKLEVKIDKDFLKGQHVNVCIYAQDNGQNKTLRQIGLSYIKVDLNQHKLNIKAHIKDSYKPLERISIPLEFYGASENTYYTAALVDDGILNLTNFKAPDPFAYLTKKPFYNLKIHDLYGYLMRFSSTNQGYGEDEALASNKSLVFENGSYFKDDKNLIKLYQGQTKVIDGKANLTFTLPRRNGSAKLMIVAFDENKVGSQSYDIKIHDSVVVNNNIPKFLYKNEKLSSTVDISYLEDKKENINLNLQCQNEIDCKNLDENYSLSQGEIKSIHIPLLASNLGLGQVNLKVKTSSFNFDEQNEISVISDNLLTYKIDFSKLQDLYKLPYIVDKNLFDYLKQREINNLKDACEILSVLFNLKDLNLLDLDFNLEDKIDLCLKTITSKFSKYGYIVNNFGDYELEKKAIELIFQAYSKGYDMNLELLKALNRKLYDMSNYSSSDDGPWALMVRAFNGENVLAQARYLFEALSDNLSLPMALNFMQIFSIYEDTNLASKAYDIGLQKIEMYKKQEALLNKDSKNRSAYEYMQNISKAFLYDRLALYIKALELGFTSDDLLSLLKSSGLNGNINDKTLAYLTKLSVLAANYEKKLPLASSFDDKRLFKDLKGKLIQNPCQKLGEVIYVIDEYESKYPYAINILQEEKDLTFLRYLEVLSPYDKSTTYLLGKLNSYVDLGYTNKYEKRINIDRGEDYSNYRIARKAMVTSQGQCVIPKVRSTDVNNPSF